MPGFLVKEASPRGGMNAELQGVEVERATLATTISPSSTQRAGNCDWSGSSSSGK
jgi:hypothetical protein